MTDSLTVVARSLSPSDLMLGGIWIGGGSPENANATIATAIELGIRDFDTAPLYFSGMAEKRLGAALGQPSLPDKAKQDIRVYTKSGRIIHRPLTEEDSPGKVAEEERQTADYSANGARVSLKDSQSRLNIQNIHTLRVHDPSERLVDDIGECVKPGGHIEGMVALRSEGAIKEVSLGMNTVGFNQSGESRAASALRLIKSLPQGTLNSALLAFGWNLFCQDGLEVLLECERRGIDVHLAGAYGGPGKGSVFSVDTAADSPACGSGTGGCVTVATKQSWAGLAKKHGLSLPAIALAFAMLPKCTTKVVVGMATPEEVRAAVSYAEESARIPSSIWQEAKGLGLLPDRVPIPVPGDGGEQ